MSIYTIRENKILAKISEFTVYRFDFVDFNLISPNLAFFDDDDELEFNDASTLLGH